ncbi:4Fe-4S dicluster domain-containing protein [Consotaella aegiceratis]|uniref:4Fe-4S dicluster domain-containing protein n=1 Tax=Consotaella aegiceratis TaxID=3097961 RepID=UPI002F40DE69
MASGGMPVVIDRDGLQALINALVRRAYQVMGPTVRDGAIVYDEIDDVGALPRGWTEHQQPGGYRLERRDDEALFGFTVGPHSWKRILHPPVETLWATHRGDDGMTVIPREDRPYKYAFLGVRSCDLHAIAIQDRIFRGAHALYTAYEARRRDAFLVAINCGEARATCFCTSMKTGPRADAGYDLCLTELVDPMRHDFLVEVGSGIGADVLHEIPTRPTSDGDLAAAKAAVQNAVEEMGRALKTEGLKELLQLNLEHARWDDIAGRCLACGNCTMVCPTCFCTTVEDHTDLTGERAERRSRWDSCFTLDYSFMQGGHGVRHSTRSRYRQWMTHKLANWIDQFGTFGCVGCGRCITWCPVGIDITEEAAAIRAAPHVAKGEAA